MIIQRTNKQKPDLSGSGFYFTCFLLKILV
ncbi:hypothetical protein [Salmonella phage PS3-1]|nr:hypothetical protein [Salmonella phage PS3-1]